MGSGTGRDGDERLGPHLGDPDAGGGWLWGNPVWRLYADYGQENRGYAVMGVASTLVGRAFGLVPAFVVGLAVDAIFLDQRQFGFPLVPDGVLPQGSVAQLELSIGVLVAATLLGAVASWFEDWGWSVFAQHIQHRLRVDAYASLQDLDVAYFTGQRTGELMSILNNDVNALETFLEDGLSSIFWVSATFFGIGAILVSLNPALAAVTLLPVPLLALFTFAFTRIIEPRYRKIRGEIGDLNSRLENNVSGIEIIKTEHTEDYEAERVAETSRDYLTANLDAVRIQITYFPGLSVISGLGFALTFLVGGYWVLQGAPFGLAGTLTPGAFVTFVIYAQQFIWPIIQFGSVVDDYERAKAAGWRVDRLLRQDVVVQDDPDATPLEVTDGRVEYDDISFRYGRTLPGFDPEEHDASGDGPDGTDQGMHAGSATPSDRVVRNVSFTAEGGETVGIVGPTGAGKSTLMKLLPRLYEVDEGAIRVDGQDVRDVTVETLRRAIGYVSQEPFLFYGTVLENVQYGSFEATREEVIAAAKAAQAHEFITNLRDGYATLVGERGVRLSGGQRQRVALARTFLKDPEILVLDEATSHVDTETEALIQQSLATFTRDRTTFVIAHRLSTVRHADHLVVVDGGRVVEQGTHEELLESGGLYANFWHVQVGDIQDLPESFLERARRRSSEVTDEIDGDDSDERDEDW